jgi:hypothetical protein
MSEQQPRLRVECHAGYRADEEPRRFFIGDREVTVDAILDRWLDPEHRYFKVRGSDGGIYILRQDLNDDRWELTMYDSGQSDTSRLSST